jgi:hypothetical protein
MHSLRRCPLCSLAPCFGGEKAALVIGNTLKLERRASPDGIGDWLGMGVGAFCKKQKGHISCFFPIAYCFVFVVLGAARLSTWSTWSALQKALPLPLGF